MRCSLRRSWRYLTPGEKCHLTQMRATSKLAMSSWKSNQTMQSNQSGIGPVLALTLKAKCHNATQTPSDRMDYLSFMAILWRPSVHRPYISWCTKMDPQLCGLHKPTPLMASSIIRVRLRNRAPRRCQTPSCKCITATRHNGKNTSQLKY